MKKIFFLFIATLLVVSCGTTPVVPSSDVHPVPVLISTGSMIPTISSFPSFSPSLSPSSSLSLSPSPSPSPSSSSGSLFSHFSFSIPILMYHHVGTYPKNADQVRKNLTVSTKTFENHLKIMQKKGYTAITFYDVQEFIDGRKDLPPKPIMISFDDGYDDNFLEAVPLLNQYHQKAVFYIITGMVGNGGYMNWEHIDTIKKQGHEIGSHTRTHPDLALISSNTIKLKDETVESKKILEGKGLGPVISFCYPSGKYSDKAENLIKENYQYARTTKNGIFTSRSKKWELPTMRMQENVDLVKFLK